MADSRGPMMRWPLAAGLVTFLLLALFAGGVIVARRAQQADALASSRQIPFGTEPTALPAATPAPSIAFSARSTAIAAPTLAAAAQTQPRAPIDAATGSTPGSTRAPATVGPTSAPVAVAPAGTPGGQFSIALVSGTPQVFAPGQAPAQPTPQAWYARVAPVDPDIASQLQDAYQRFWQVRAQALLDLDTSPLGDVMDGDVLQRERTAIDQLRDQDLAQQIDVQHHAQLLHGSADEAALVDEYVSHVVPIDRTTNEALQPSAETTSRLAYHFRRLSGTWKVVEAVQLEYE